LSFYLSTEFPYTDTDFNLGFSGSLYGLPFKNKASREVVFAAWRSVIPQNEAANASRPRLTVNKKAACPQGRPLFGPVNQYDFRSDSSPGVMIL
jgi:hypothetical protein